MTTPSNTLELFSIGHSSQPSEHFLSLLQQHGIGAVADVRSSPWSRFAPQFNRELLAQSLKEAGIAYVFLGQELGGRPEEDELYDDDGHVLYGEVAKTDRFQEGIERLESGASQGRVAMMCSEEDPTHCHRRLLVTRVLRDHGVNVLHIRSDGKLEPESAYEQSTREEQQLLFGVPEEKAWRSTQSVSRKRPQPTSSGD